MALSSVEPAKTCDSLPELAEAMHFGVSAAHVDAVASELRRLQPGERKALLALDDVLAAAATSQNVDEFTRTLRRKVRAISGSDGCDRLIAQRRRIFLRTGVDSDSGQRHVVHPRRVRSGKSRRCSTANTPTPARSIRSHDNNTWRRWHCSASSRVSVVWRPVVQCPT